MKLKQTDGLVSSARTWGYDIVWTFSAVRWPLIASTARSKGLKDKYFYFTCIEELTKRTIIISATFKFPNYSTNGRFSNERVGKILSVFSFINIDYEEPLLI